MCRFLLVKVFAVRLCIDVLAVCAMAAQAERVIIFSSESVIEGHLFADRVKVSFARFSQLGGTHVTARQQLVGPCQCKLSPFC